jgi:glycosyltransferase involved in cell wall biosynthesis
MDRPLAIAVNAHVKHPIAEPFAGGLEAHTASLARGLAARGHAVTLFAAAGSAADIHNEPLCAPTQGLTDMAQNDFGPEHAAYLALMTSLPSRAFDIVHNNSLHYLPAGMAGQLPMPMVTTLHTPAFWEMAGALHLTDQANNTLVAVSPVIAAAWSGASPVERVILNGIDLDAFSYRARPAADPYLIWTGRIVPEKGLHLAIEAARLAGLPLRIAGPIADEAYFRSAIEPQLGGPVRYLGHLKHAALVAPVAGAAACLCTPMWEEPYGLVVAEALACGTPVAGFARGALPALLDAGSGILVPAGDVSALAQAARAATGLSRAACRRRAEEIGDAAQMIAGYEALYAALLAAPRPALSAPPPGLESVTCRTSLRALYAQNERLEIAA